MSCRRSREIDLSAFLEEPRASAFAAFREHYPLCRDCAQEVRAWTELDEQLRAASSEDGQRHPAVEQLVRFAESPTALSPGERRSVEEHLAACPVCRDELSQLAHFSPAALRDEPAAAPRRGVGDLLRGLRGLVLHPAFAYAWVGLLLFSFAVRDLAPEGAPEQFASLEARDRVRVLPKRDLLIDDLAKDKFAESEFSGREFAVRQYEPQAPAPPREIRVDVAKSADRATESKVETAPRPSRPAAAEERLGMPLVDEPIAAAAAFASGAAALEVGRDDLAAEPFEALLLSVDRPVAVSAQRAAGGLRLRIPLPARAAAAEIRVVAASGRRELRERRAPAAHKALGAFAGQSSGGPAEIDLPAGWLRPGAYRVEVRVAGEDDAASPTRVFDLVVR